MSTQQQAVDYLSGGWRDGPHLKTIMAAGGLGVDQDGGDGFQCKDFANTLGEVLGAPLPRGNAIVLAQVLAPGWSWPSSPQPGDLAVRHYVYGGVDYGDVVGITAVNGTTLTTVGQNQVNPSLTVGHVPTTAIHQAGQFFKFVRRNYEGESMNNGDVDNWYLSGWGRKATAEEHARYDGKPWSAFFYNDGKNQYEYLRAHQGGGDVKPYDGPQLFIKE